MSGTDPSQKRRKRRKTRTERNLSRNIAPKPRQDQKQKSSKKDTSSCPTQANQNRPMSYTLRSGKGVASFVPSNYKEATAGTITQDRLTTTYQMLANSKSSDWMKRGPIPETEATKKKVEMDLKRILNIPGVKSNQGDSGDCHRDHIDVVDVSQEHNSQGAEHCAMEVDVPAQSAERAAVSQVVAESARRLQPQQEKSLTTKQSAMAASTPAGSGKHSSGRPTPRSNDKPTLTSPSPSKPDQLLEPECPVQEIADKLLKEVKMKFAAMFPNRDIHKELCYDLHKLAKQSSGKVASPKSKQRMETSILFTDPALCTPLPGMAVQPVACSTLSACRSSGQSFRDTGSQDFPHILGDNSHLYLSENGGSIVGHKNCHTGSRSKIPSSRKSVLPRLEGDRNSNRSSLHIEDEESEMRDFFPDTIVLKDDQATDPIIRIVKVHDSEDSSDNYDAENDGMGGLSAACCYAFFNDAQDLELQQRQQKQQQQQTLQDHLHNRQNYKLSNQGYEWMSKDASKKLFPTSHAASWKNSCISNILNGERYSDRHDSWMDLSAEHVSNKPLSLACSTSSSRNTSSTDRGCLGSSNNYYLSATAGITTGVSSPYAPPHLLRSSSSHFSNSNLPNQHSWSLHNDSYRSKTTQDGFFLNRCEKSSSRGNSYSCLPHPSLFPEPHSVLSGPGQAGEIFSGNRKNTSTSFLNSERFIDTKEGRGSSSFMCGDSDGGLSKRRTSSRLGPHLVQSRHNFQTALESAHRGSSGDFGCVPGEMGDSMDEDDIDIFPSLGKRAPVSFSYLKAPHHPTHNRGQHQQQRPLAELHTHQADMQRQARDFLDDLDRCSSRANNKVFPHSLFGDGPASPPSTVSAPLLLAVGSRSKDLPLKVGSFI